MHYSSPVNCGTASSRLAFAKHANAFTLIELLVVIAIIAILAAILFPVFAQARAKARQAACLSNMKQVNNAILMYVQDYDETFPMTMETVSTGFPQTVSYWAVQNYHAAVNPYIKMGMGIENKQSVWWDPSDPDRDIDAMWGSFSDNGYITGTPRTLADIASPAGTVYSTLRGDNWAKLLGMTIPNPLPAKNDPFWGSVYFDMCLDPWANTNDSSDPYHYSTGKAAPPCSLYPGAAGCGTWDTLIAKKRHNGLTVIAYCDGHVKAMPFERTWRSETDSDWDLK